jgi:ParB family chromosome partitioning protein
MSFQGNSIFWVEVEKIVPNPYQPRREFDEYKLKELADSVRMYGVLQPLIVTRRERARADGTFYTEYELIAGERRLRASKLAGLAQVPVIIRDGEQSEQEKLELAIIENLQREDLNAVDRALAFRQLSDMFGLSYTQVAEKVGRSREYISNSVRLLGLPEHMLDALRRGELGEGHARTLLMLSDRKEEQEVVFREVVLKKLSVREVERIARKIATDRVRKHNAADLDAELLEIEKRFMETLGTRVQIQKTDYGGRLTIDYFSVGDLEAMLARMKTKQAGETAGTDAALALAAHTPLVMAPPEQSPVIAAKEDSLQELYKTESETSMEAPPEQGMAQTPEPDESDLYSIRKFTI